MSSRPAGIARPGGTIGPAKIDAGPFDAGLLEPGPLEAVSCTQVSSERVLSMLRIPRITMSKRLRARLDPSLNASLDASLQCDRILSASGCVLARRPIEVRPALVRRFLGPDSHAFGTNKARKIGGSCAQGT
ncbi:MAG TPA: hypothetical protein VFQ61_04430 [Polyangiaceae bacterium]|nr:hypothetical protein [Polyangiaceae bacterium]